MIRISDIERDWKYICDQNASIVNFLFDDVSAINQYTKMDFPLCVLKLPQKSSIEDYKKYWELWDFTIYMCTTNYQADEVTLSEKYDSLRVLCEQAISEFVHDPNKYHLASGVTFEYGQDEFVSNLVVVKADFQIRLFNCRDYESSGQIVTIIDNTDVLVGTVKGKSTLKVLAKDQNGTTISASYVLANGVLSLTVNTGSSWLLAGGVWSDSGVWDDTAVWID